MQFVSSYRVCFVFVNISKSILYFYKYGENFVRAFRESPASRYLTAPSTVSGSVPKRVMAESLRPMSLSEWPQWYRLLSTMSQRSCEGAVQMCVSIGSTPAAELWILRSAVRSLPEYHNNSQCPPLSGPTRRMMPFSCSFFKCT